MFPRSTEIKSTLCPRIIGKLSLISQGNGCQEREIFGIFDYHISIKFVAGHSPIKHTYTFEVNIQVKELFTLRISKQQMKILRKCGQTKNAVVYFTRQEEQDAANYLVERKFLKKPDNSPFSFQITEEGKAYAYEFRDMRFHRLLTSVISLLALIISIIAISKP